MANKILRLFETIVKPTISLASIGAGAGRICTAVDNTTLRAQEGRVYAQIRSGGSAPTAGHVYRFFLARRSNDGTNDICDDGLSATDAGVSVEPVMSECIGSIIVTNSANTTFKGSFPLFDLPLKFGIVCWNATTQTWDSTGSNHDLQVQLYSPEIQ